MLPDLFERARLAAVETEAELQDLALSLVERGEQASNFLGEERRGRNFEGRVGTASSTTSPSSASPFAQRLGERQRLGGEAKRLGDLLFRHLDLGGEFGKGGRTAVLQF